jgi:hypothetical protein
MCFLKTNIFLNDYVVIKTKKTTEWNKLASGNISNGIDIFTHTYLRYISTFPKLLKYIGKPPDFVMTTHC